MRRGLVQLLITDKKTNIHRRRLNLLASLATYVNGSGGDAIGGEAGDFLLSLLVSSATSRQARRMTLRTPP